MVKGKKVGLALSSGGARGLAHIGVIKVLEKNNIPIDCIAGTSMGAVVGAYYALYRSVVGLEKFALSFRKRDLLKYADLNDPRISLIKGEKVRNLLNNLFDDKKFKDTKIPLRIGATALEDGSKIVFKSGKIADAVFASGSVPGMLPPVEFKGKHLVDGGLADATPVDLLQDMNADIIVAVDLFSLDRYNIKLYNTRNVLYRTYDIMMSKLANYSTKEYNDNIIIVKPKAGKRTDMLAFHKAAEKINAGEIAAKKAVKQIKELLDAE